MLSDKKPHVAVSYQEIIKDPRSKLCFSIHPRDVFKDGFLVEDNIKALMEHSLLPGVVAIGEIGLDHSHARFPRVQQMQADFLTKLLQQIQESEDHRHLPLVLHVREGYKGQQTLPANKRCLQILKDCGVPRSHRIYRHCFTGGIEEAKMWLAEYPNTVFGMNPKSVSWDDAHIDNLTVFGNLEWRHIMVETDAPQIKFHSDDRQMTTPWSTYDIFLWLAAIRHISLGEAVRRVAETFSSFYGLPPPSHILS